MPADPTPQPIAYSIAEAARISSLSVRSLRYLLRSGRLRYVKLGRRVLIRHTDLEALMRKHYVKPMVGLDAEAPIRPDIRVR
jgi:excisionase family DNA binding protein